MDFFYKSFEREMSEADVQKCFRGKSEAQREMVRCAPGCALLSIYMQYNDTGVDSN